MARSHGDFINMFYYEICARLHALCDKRLMSTVLMNQHVMKSNIKGCQLISTLSIFLLYQYQICSLSIKTPGCFTDFKGATLFAIFVGHVHVCNALGLQRQVTLLAEELLSSFASLLLCSALHSEDSTNGAIICRKLFQISLLLHITIKYTHSVHNG